MGLALVEKIVSQHGGQVAYRDRAEGTTFRLRLPLDPGVEIASGAGVEAAT